MVVQMFLLFIPSLLLMLVAIFAYGLVWGSLLALLAVPVASTAGYALAASWARMPSRALFGKAQGRNSLLIWRIMVFGLF